MGQLCLVGVVRAKGLKLRLLECDALGARVKRQSRADSGYIANGAFLEVRPTATPRLNSSLCHSVPPVCLSSGGRVCDPGPELCPRVGHHVPRTRVHLWGVHRAPVGLPHYRTAPG